MIDTSLSLHQLNLSGLNTLSENIGLEYTEINKDYLIARMPVDRRTCQQLGMMHGGASAALAETVGSMAAYLSIDREKYYCVGLEMKINHIKPVRRGYVYAKATAIHLGNQTHVWQIITRDENVEVVAISTLTMAILPIDAQIKKNIRNILTGPKS